MLGGEFMRKTNVEIRQKMKEKGVTQWMIADVLDKSEGWVVRLFRHELDGASKQLILDAVDRAGVKFGE